MIDVSTRSGSRPALLLQPGGPTVGPIVYVHGGGWVIGAIADYEVLARKLAAETGCTVLVPDYRLAPEHPFPAGHAGPGGRHRAILPRSRSVIAA